MRLQIKPLTRPGKWAARLMVAAVVAFLLLIIFAEWLRVIPDLIVSILGPVAVFALLAAGILGLIAITRKKERSLLVYLAVGFAGVEVLFFLFSLLHDLVFKQ